MNEGYIENNLIILTVPTINQILKADNPADALALYTFYYHFAKRQKTNRVRATDAFVKTGLKWGIKRVGEAKETLENLGLITVVKSKDKAGKITGWYVQMNYIFTAEKEKEIHNTQKRGVEEKPEYPKTTSGRQETNALSGLNINALSDSTDKSAQVVSELIYLFKGVNPAYEKFYANKTQRKAIQNLITQFPRDQLLFLIEVLPKTNRMPYAPTITTPCQLEDKAASLISFLQKKKLQTQDERKIV